MTIHTRFVLNLFDHWIETRRICQIIHLVMVLGIAPDWIIASTCDVGPPSVSFLEGDEASQTIVGPENDRFFAELQPREAAAMTGLPLSALTDADARHRVRQSFADAVMPFADEERTVLQQIVNSFHKDLADKFPRLICRPWKFIKVRNQLCGGFSFTRGDSIVVSQRTLTRIVISARRANDLQHERQQTDTFRSGRSLLLHEQLHVLQRDDPDRFHPLYEQILGFERHSVVIDDRLKQLQIRNPDGEDLGWIWKLKRPDGSVERFWLGAILAGDSPIPEMERDFVGIAVPLAIGVHGELSMSRDEAGVPAYRRIDHFAELTQQFPISLGYDHPNEVAAYLLARIVDHPDLDTPLTPAQRSLILATQQWFLDHLR